MCGIAAIFRKGERPLPVAAVLQEMASAIVHRGPDDWGAFADGDVLLAAVRLAIVGTAGGRQPHAGCPPSRVTCVVNGEIYNHGELRGELGAHGLTDPCDTATIPHLYEEHGEALVEKLRGMFAFALWDAREKKLVVARDRLGIKPLFLAETPDFLVLASEAKAIFASGLVAPAIDRDALDDLFSLGYPCPPRTMFQGVRALQPGHLAVARRGRALELRRYWRAPVPAPGEHRRGPARALAAELRQALRQSVQDHLISDIPVAAMLSGGIDSSSVAALMREVTGRAPPTFSLAFGGAEGRSYYDESAHIAAVSARLGGRGHVTRLSTDSAALLPEMIWSLELPLIMPGAIGGIALAEDERFNGYRVTLSGDGADELLGGYDVFRAARLRHALGASGLGFLGRPLAAAAARLAGQPRGLARAAWPAAPERELAAKWGGVAPPWLGAWQLLDLDRERLLGVGGHRPRPVLEPPAGFRALLRDDLARLDPLDAAIAVELETRLPSWILVISDRSSMARGVEVRVPFLDERVVELLLAMPPALKMRGFREKAILRESVKDLLPPSIIGRRKQPFMTPIAPWFFHTGAPAFVAEALSKRALEDAALFDPEIVARLQAELAAAPPNHVDRFRRELILLLILGTQLLSRQFTRGLDRPTPRFKLAKRAP